MLRLAFFRPLLAPGPASEMQIPKCSAVTKDIKSIKTIKKKALQKKGILIGCKERALGVIRKTRQCFDTHLNLINCMKWLPHHPNNGFKTACLILFGLATAGVQTSSAQVVVGKKHYWEGNFFMATGSEVPTPRALHDIKAWEEKFMTKNEKLLSSLGVLKNVRFFEKQIPVAGRLLVGMTGHHADPMQKMVQALSGQEQLVSVLTSGLDQMSRSAGWNAAYSSILAPLDDPRSLLRHLDHVPEKLEPNFSTALTTHGARRSQVPANGATAPQGVAQKKAAGEVPVPVLKKSQGINPCWPFGGRLDWYQQPEYSQLAEARRMVDQLYGGVHPKYPVTIAHLDTGCDQHNASLPLYFDKARSITFQTDGGVVNDPALKGGITNPKDMMADHGTSTLGVLAGRGILPDYPMPKEPVGYEGWLGAAPGATVFEVKVNGIVVHLATSSMCKGIDYAVANGADVISISHGGLPSEHWADAVNNAYEHGVAIFAASSDFFALPVLGIAITPYQTVYPAAFNRVISVPGVTQRHRSYGLRGTLSSFLPWNWGKSMLRGSYGPGGSYGPMTHALSAYSPNIPFAQLSIDDNGAPTGHNDLLDADGGGTSASTPQVAAAAALYLAYHHKTFAAMPRDWRRAEAVYTALLTSAGDKTRPMTERNEPSLFFGAGTLKAADALKLPPCKLKLQKRPKSTVGLQWLSLILHWSGNVPDALPVEKARPGSQEALLNKMTEVEAAQLVATDRALWEMVNSHGLTPEINDSASLQRLISKDDARKLVKRLAAHAEVSDYLQLKIQNSAIITTK